MLLTGDKDAKYTAAASERMTKELQQHGIEAEFHLVPNGEHLNAYLGYTLAGFRFSRQALSGVVND